MKWKTLAVLSLVALAGCGGDDDSSADNGSASDTASTSADTSAAQPTTEAVKGKLTEAKLIKVAGLQPKGDHYVWSDGCEVKAVAADKDAVKELQKAATNPRAVIPNKSASAAIEIVEVSYPCAVHASLVLRGIP